MIFDPTTRLGWVSPNDRTNEQHDAHAAAEATMPQFAMPQLGRNEVFENTGKFRLTDLWSHPAVVEALGFPFKRFHQLTGSCVGAGGGNALLSLIAGDAVLRGDPEEIFLPFWLYDYALSRQLGGWNTRGNGSLGSLFAQTVRDNGVTKWTNAPGLPRIVNDGDEGIRVANENVEYDWSVGSRVTPELIALGKAHPVKTTARIRTVDDAKNALLNKFPITFACDRYIRAARVRDSGSDACLVGELDSSGGHQTSLQGVWEHPQLGLLFLNQNNWPSEAYPRDPAGAPPCAVWQPADDVQKALDRYNAEVYAFSAFEGFPAQNVPTDWMSLR